MGDQDVATEITGENPRPLITVIAPMYNEEESVESTYSSLYDTLEKIGASWEIIFVNDGSVDKTKDKSLAISAKDPRLRVIGYPVNQGRGKALRTGFEHAKGEYVFTIDFDLSYSPDHIVNMYQEFQRNPQLNIVLCSPYMPGGRAETHGMASRVFVSRLGNWILSKCFKNSIHTFTCILRGYRRQVLDQLVLDSNDKVIHLEILSKAMALGMNISEIPAVLRPRKKGKSKSRLRKHSQSHLIFAFEERPIIFFGLGGVLMIILGLVLGVYITFLRFTGQLNPGRPLMYMVVILFLGGILILCFGLMSLQIVGLRREIFKLHSRIAWNQKKAYQDNKDLER